MKHNYWAHMIGRNGRVIGRVVIACDDDASAKSRVEQLVDGQALELWDGDRKIAAFEARLKRHGFTALRPPAARTRNAKDAKATAR
jgi:hypothetical protein